MNDEAAAELSVALVGGRYEIIEELGRGATAIVHRAHDAVLGRDVAMKLFPPHTADPDEINQYYREMNVLAAMSHPSLVTLFDAGTDTRDAAGSQGFLVMELVQGTDLRQRLNQGPLPPGLTAGLGAELADALSYIHLHGVLHRDIKPANILLHEEPNRPVRPKLTDFGIARVIDGARSTMTGAVPGTAAYLSPEQASGSSLGPPSDVYSLGLVLLECLTGRTEYPGGAIVSAVARLTREPAIPADLGPPWIQLLRAMTARDPAMRPSAAEVAQTLQIINAATAAQPGLQATKEPVFPRTGISPGASLDDGQETALTSLRAYPTAQLSLGKPKAARQRAGHKKWKRILWASGAVLVLVGVAALFVLVQLAPVPRTEFDPVPYPSITGPLGDRLEELQERIEP